VGFRIRSLSTFFSAFLDRVDADHTALGDDFGFADGGDEEVFGGLLVVGYVEV
jgi:hypothetical protein